MLLASVCQIRQIWFVLPCRKSFAFSDAFADLTAHYRIIQGLRKTAVPLSFKYVKSCSRYITIIIVIFMFSSGGSLIFLVIYEYFIRRRVRL